MTIALSPAALAVLESLNPDDFGDIDAPGRWWILEDGGRAATRHARFYVRFGHEKLYGLKRVSTEER